MNMNKKRTNKHNRHHYTDVEIEKRREEIEGYFKKVGREDTIWKSGIILVSHDERKTHVGVLFNVMNISIKRKAHVCCNTAQHVHSSQSTRKTRQSAERIKG